MFHLLAFLTMSIWGSTFVSTKMLLANGLTPAAIFLLRFSMAYIGLSLVWLIRHRHPHYTPEGRGGRWFCRSWRDELGMLAAGLTGGSLYFLTENTALQMAMASNVSLIVCLSPLLTALLAIPLHTGERTNTSFWAGSLIAFTGVAFVSWGSTHESGGAAPLIGNLLALTAAALWAVYQHVVRPLAQRYGTLMLTRKVFGYGLITIIPVVLSEPAEPWNALGHPVVWGNLLFLGLVASLLCYAAWNVVVARLGAIISANYIYLNPLVACLASYLILGERLSPTMLIGGAAILTGLYIVMKPKGKLLRNEFRTHKHAQGGL